MTVIESILRQQVSVNAAAMGLEYLFLQLHRVDFAAYSRGSTQPRLTQTDSKAQRGIVPPSALFRRFQGVARDVFAKVDATNSESHSLAAMRDTLLPRLLSGEIRVKAGEKVVEGVA